MSNHRRASRTHPTAGARPTPATRLPSTAAASANAAEHGHVQTERIPPQQPGVNAEQIQMLLGLIATGGLDNYLPLIQTAISERHEYHYRAQSNQAAAHIDIGDRIQLGHDIRPLYLHGATGTVTGWARQNAIIQLDHPVGRYTTGQISCPPLALHPLPE